MSKLRALAVLAVALAVAGAALPVRAQDRPPYDIPAQDASTALVELCLRAGCAFGLTAEPGRRYRTRPVRGARTWQQAIRQMLAGTSLSYRIVDDRSVRVWADAPRAEAARPAPPAELPEAVVDPITVVGRFSEGIDTALVRKRQADVILDSVSAARIGELPAANLAEALQRIPGVAIEREVGEGQFVSVRGLGPLFQSVTLNGAPVAFNENIRNSTQSGRQFRFRALSADLLASATLTKTASADLIDGGIGSNIDIRTVRGLEGRPFLSGQVAGHLETRSQALSPDLTLSGRWRDGSRRFGLVGGVSAQEREVQYDRLQTQRYRDLVLDGRTVAVPNDLRTTIEREDRDRVSAFLGLQWRPNPDLGVTFDTLVSRFGNAIREDRIVYEFGDRLANGSLVPGSLRVEDGVLTAATITDGRISNNLEVSDQTHDNLATSLAVEATVGDWRLRPRLSYSRAVSGLGIPLQRIAAVSPERVTYGFDFGADPLGDRRIDRLRTDLDLTDASALTFGRYGVRAIDVQDDDLTALFAADRDLDRRIGPLKLDRVETGFQVSDRGRDYQRRDRDAVARPGTTVGPDFYGVLTPANAFAGIVRDRSSPWIAADFDRFRTAFILPGERDGVIFSAEDLMPTGTDRQSSYTVAETLLAAYGRLDVSATIAGRPARGNLGLRVVEGRTEVVGSILGLDTAGALEVRPLRQTDRGADWLPSANLTVELGPDTLLRLGLSRSITRPSLADLGAATVPASTLVNAIFTRGQAEIDDPAPSTIFTGVGGNPELTPYVSTNYDISLERYFDGFGALSLGLFHKTIDDYVLVVDQVERLTFATRAGPPVEAEVLMSRPRNLGRAEVTGLELGFSRRWDNGLGVWAAATFTDAESRDLSTGQTSDLQGVSRRSWSVSPFLERGPFEAHLSWTWRSAFRSVADLQGGGVSAFVVGATGILDAAASWHLRPGLTAFVEGGNLTDAVDIAYDGDPSRPLQVSSSGRSVTLGLKFSL